MNLENLKNWQIEFDENYNHAELIFNQQDYPVNTFNLETLGELDAIIEHCYSLKKLQSLSIVSGKPKGFIAGADLDKFKAGYDRDKLAEMLELGNKVFTKIETAPFISIAVIEGFCLGGGLEFALSCSYRIILADPKIRIGLPEVMLGIHPGWGGSIRLPRLIGSLKALDLILAGKLVDPKTAKKLGIVDAVVPNYHIEHAVEYYKKINKSKTREYTYPQWLRNLIAKYIIKPKLNKKISENNYPAPFAVLDNWVEYGIYAPEALAVETQSFLLLTQHPSTENLLRVYFLNNYLKNQANAKDCQIKHVHVIGAGVMGGDIAAWCALQGFLVTLQDINGDKIATTINKALDLYKSQRLPDHKIQAAMDNLLPDPKNLGLARADLIIEAVIENLEVKQKVFADIVALAKPNAILATNTSTLPLDDLVPEEKFKQRLIGLHFFNPVAKMKLVEVIRDEFTLPAVMEQALAFSVAISKLPVVVKSYPGFLVNRTLMPYLLESVRLLEEGVPPEIIDQAALKFGMPMGPVTLADTVGLDICLAAVEILKEIHPAPIPEILKTKVQQGHLGKKTGKGFYDYKSKINFNLNLSSGSETDKYDLLEIQDRLVYILINEAVACWREKIVNSIDDVDAAMIFGTGFAPFRGGPLYYIKQQPKESVMARMQELNKKFGARFTADPGWQELFEVEI